MKFKVGKKYYQEGWSKLAVPWKWFKIVDIDPMKKYPIYGVYNTNEVNSYPMSAPFLPYKD